VATWNCFGVPAGLAGVMFGTPHVPERFVAEKVAKALEGYDVICVQESFLDAVAEFMGEVAERLGMHLWHDRSLAHVLDTSPFGGGLAILAPQPIEVVFEMFEERGCGFDAWACKGFATCELRTRAGERFRVANLHFQSDDPKLAPHVYVPARAAQLEALLDALQQSEGGIPTIVCGDLNVPEGSEEYHRVLAPQMRKHNFVDVALGMGLHTYTPARNALVARLDPLAEGVRVDYIWTSDGAGRTWRTVTPPTLLLAEPMGEQEHMYASDHFGIGVELELT
jgi:endonuclease/exonuclease/phosphatase family metal-dependent hydrolase